ncbi:PQQ-binding-like beta-propeller repeat protein [Mycolicibacterium pulveris]|nr:PQQ-binding-like beta-propeller repeat protein [Mycolicibacterium pulveris]
MPVVVAPDGGQIYVGGPTKKVTVLGSANGGFIKDIDIAGDPVAMAVSADNTTLYLVSTSADHFLSAVDIATGVETPLAAYTAYDLALSLDGELLYVTDPANEQVVVYSTATNEELYPIAVGAHTSAVAISPDGSLLYVANPGAVTVIDTATQTVITTYPAGFILLDIAAGPGGSYAVDLVNDALITAHLVSIV